MRKKVVFFTGSGISVNSGLPAYRAVDGIWDNHDINEVATVGALWNDANKVNDFFNKMRKKASVAQPSIAHKIISEFQDEYDVTVLTQNVDDLHEKSGSEVVYHLHGNIFETTYMNRGGLFDYRREDINRDEVDETKDTIRPNVVLFGEIPHHMEDAKRIISSADHVIVIGASLLVFPVNMMILDAYGLKEITIIDNNPCYFEDSGLYMFGFQPNEKTSLIMSDADTGMLTLKNRLIPV